MAMIAQLDHRFLDGRLPPKDIAKLDVVLVMVLGLVKDDIKSEDHAGIRTRDSLLADLPQLLVGH